MAEFNPAAISRAYSDEQWTKKEEWYVSAINAIQIPPSPTPADISNIASKIEQVLSLARLDMAFVEQNHNRFETQVKLQESLLLTTLSSIQGVKLTVGEKESYIKNHISTSPFDATRFGPLTLYELRDKSDARYIALKNFINTLTDKKDLLIIHSSANKTEAALNNFSSSVPKN